MVIGILLGVLTLAGVLGGAFYFLKGNKQATENVEKPTAQKDTVATKPALIDTVQSNEPQRHVAEAKASNDNKKKETKKTKKTSKQKTSSSQNKRNKNKGGEDAYIYILGDD